jgi:hypothetical protein
VHLTETKQREVSGQLAQKPQGGRPEGGVSAAVRELGIERTEARRAGKIAKIKPEVKEATKSAGIDGNLHRAELTPDERDEHIQEWHRLTEQGVK